MADNFRFAQLQPYSLAGSGAITGATSITLKSMLDIDGNTLSMATTFGSIGFGTLEPGNGNQEEQIAFTSLVNNSNGTVTLGGVVNVSMTYPYTQTSGLSKTHPGSSIFVISNTSGFYDKLTSKSDDETITGTWTFTNPNYPRMDTATPAPTDDEQLATKKYVDDTAIAGAPDASVTTKGITKLSVAPVAAANPIAVGDNDPRLGTATQIPPSYGASATGTDAYAITLGTSPGSYATGAVFFFKADVANTGACTLNVNGLGAKSLKVNSNLDPQNNYIKAGSLVECEYDGTNLQILSVASKPSVSQSGEEVYGASATGNDTYVITLAPVPAAYVIGMTVRFLADVGNTGTATLDVNGLGAKTIKKNVTLDLETGDILANQIVDLVYDGTNFQMSSNPARQSIIRYAVNADEAVGDYITSPIILSAGSANGWTSNSGTFTPRAAGAIYTGFNSSIFVVDVEGTTNASGNTYLLFDTAKTIRLRFAGCFQLGGAADTAGFCVGFTNEVSGTGGVNFSNVDDTVLDSIKFNFASTGTCNAAVSNAAARTKTSIAGNTNDAFHIYEIVWTPGTDVKFYIDSVLKATITTNIPTASAKARFAIGNGNATDSEWSLHTPTISQHI